MIYNDYWIIEKNKDYILKEYNLKDSSKLL